MVVFWDPRYTFYKTLSCYCFFFLTGLWNIFLSNKHLPCSPTQECPSPAFETCAAAQVQMIRPMIRGETETERSPRQPTSLQILWDIQSLFSLTNAQTACTQGRSACGRLIGSLVREVWESDVSYRVLLQLLYHLQPNHVRLLPTFERGNAWDVCTHLWRGLFLQFETSDGCTYKIWAPNTLPYGPRGHALWDWLKLGCLQGKVPPFSSFFFVLTHFEHRSGRKLQDSHLLAVSKAAWRHTDAWWQTVFSGKNFVGFSHWLLFSYAQIRMHPLHLTVNCQRDLSSIKVICAAQVNKYIEQWLIPLRRDDV